MKAGDKTRIQCESCDSEADIIFEPKAVEMDEANRPTDVAEITNCPFCGSESIIVE